MPAHTLAKPVFGSSNLFRVVRRSQIGGQPSLSANRLRGCQKPAFKFTLGKDHEHRQSHSCRLRAGQERWGQRSGTIVVAIEKNEDPSTRACFKRRQFDCSLEFTGSSAHQAAPRPPDRLLHIQRYSGIDIMSNSTKQDWSRLNVTVAFHNKTDLDRRHSPAPPNSSNCLGDVGPKSLSGRNWSSRSSSPGV